MQEVVVPQQAWPPEVRQAFADAAAAHQARQVDTALELYERARMAWIAGDTGQNKLMTPSVTPRLPAEGELCLCVAASGVLLTAGRDEEAVAELQRGGSAREGAHPPPSSTWQSSWHAAAGVALFHTDQLKVC